LPRSAGKTSFMTSREVVKALLNKQLPERMGVFEHFWPETLSEVWPKQGYPAGVPPEERFSYDMGFATGWLQSEPFPGQWEVLEENDEWRLTRDGRGAHLKYWKRKSGTPEHVDFEVTTPETWKRYKEPLLATDPSRIPNVEEAKRNLEDLRAKGRYAMFGTLFIFELMRATIGDQNFLPALIEEKEWIHDFCQTYLDFFKRHYDLIFREIGVPDGMFIYEDWGYNHGLFCSPELMREMVMPYETEWVHFLKSYGCQVVLHSCGNITQAVPMAIEAGFDCIQPLEAKAGCNLVELSGQYGHKVAFMGNIDVTALGKNTKEAVESEVLPKLQAMKEMRVPYFFHSDHSIPPEVNLETYEYALSLFRENSSY